MATTIEGRVRLQYSRAKFIDTIYEESLTSDFKNLSVVELQSRLNDLLHQWKRLDEQHEKFLTAKDPVILEHRYIQEGVYDRCLTRYSAANATLLHLISEKGENPNLAESFRRGFEEREHSPASSRLPEITIPTFNGDYSQWTEFRDSFHSLIGSRTNISAIAKIQYLRGCLKGDASRVIAGLTILDSSFEHAWRLLTSRYENQRLLITAHLDTLFGSSPMIAHSAYELNEVLNSVESAINSITALNISMAQFGEHALVYALVRRLSPKLRESWECRVGSSQVYPTMDVLKEFLNGRARAMENMEYNKTKESHSKTGGSSRASTAQPSGKSGARINVGTSSPQPGTSSSSAGVRTSNCAYCEGDHYIVTCARFKALTPVARRQAVIDRYLYFNCLGRHSVRVCQTTKRCQTCSDKHHTLIHDAKQRRTGSSQLSGSAATKQAAASTGPPPPTTGST